MPHEIAIEADVVCSRFWGDVTIEELRAAKQEITDTPGFRRELSHIIDVSEIALASFSPEALQEFERDRSIVSPLALQILVVSPQLKVLRIARTLQSMGESNGRSILIVYSQDEARSMLRLARPAEPSQEGKEPAMGERRAEEQRRA